MTTAAQPFTDAGLTVNLLFSEATEGTTNQVTPAWVFAPVATRRRRRGVGHVHQLAADARLLGSGVRGGVDVVHRRRDQAVQLRQLADLGERRLHALRHRRRRRSTAARRRRRRSTAQRRCGPRRVRTYEVWNDARSAHPQRRWARSRPTSRSWRRSRRRPAAPNVYDASNRARPVPVRAEGGLFVREPGRRATSPTPTSPPRTVQPAGARSPTCTGARPTPPTWVRCRSRRSRSRRRPIRTSRRWTSASCWPYALANNIQIFELYPEEWLSANSPTWPSFVPANQAKYQEALQTAAQTARRDERAVAAGLRFLAVRGGRTPQHCGPRFSSRARLLASARARATWARQGDERRNDRRALPGSGPPGGGGEGSCLRPQ